jgi:hypothetical protein
MPRTATTTTTTTTATTAPTATGRPRGRPRGSGQLGEEGLGHKRLTVRLPTKLYAALDAASYTREAPDLARTVRMALEHYLACPNKRQTETVAARAEDSPPLDDQTCALASQIAARFSDGKWHRLSAIATAVHADVEVVRAIVDLMVRDGAFRTVAEQKPAPLSHGGFAYRLMPGGTKKLDLTAFYAEVQPVLDDIEHVINGHSVDFSQQAMKVAFARFRRVIERVAR